MTGTLMSRPFGSSSDAISAGQIGVSTGNGGWSTVGQNFAFTVSANASLFIQADIQTEANMQHTCVGGHRVTYELYGP